MGKKSFNGVIEEGGEFPPELNRYHLYIGLSCPFAHRVNLVRHLKGLEQALPTSVARLRPKDDGIPEWVFSTKEKEIPGATEDPVFGVTVVREIYQKVDPEYEGKFTIPLLVDTKTRQIVNNESAEMMRFLSKAFNSVLSPDLAKINLYPSQLQSRIDQLSPLLQKHLAVAVYRAGFNPTQEGYEENLVEAFAMLNQLEQFLHRNGGPFILDYRLTELDIVLFPCLIRFDVVYHQHMKCNLGMIRHDYPYVHRYLQNLYWNVPGFRETTNFEHIKENYTKAHRKVNPTSITPLGPYPDILPWSSETTEVPESIQHPRVLASKVELPDA